MPTPAAPTPGADGTVTDCSSALSTRLVTALAGRAVPGPVAAPIGEDKVLTGCLWGDLTTDGVQVTDVPASAWALTLPGIAALLQDSALHRRQVAAIRAAAARVSAGAMLDPDTACAAFSDVLQLGGISPDQHSTVAFLPDASQPQGITGQGCAEGRYRSLLVVRPDLTGSQAELDAVAKVFAAGGSLPG